MGRTPSGKTILLSTIGGIILILIVHNLGWRLDYIRLDLDILQIGVTIPTPTPAPPGGSQTNRQLSEEAVAVVGEQAMVAANENSPTGKITYTCQIFNDNKRDQICMVNTDGTNLKRLTMVDSAIHWYPSFSPDGNSIVLSSNRTGKFELYEIDLSGNAVQITNDIGQLYAPEISPDGQYIVFSNEREGSMGIWLIERSGLNPKHVFTPPSGIAVDPVWSPDGSKILFAAGEGDHKNLYTIKPDGSDLVQLTSGQRIRGRSAWSNDGEKIVTYIGSGWDREIYIMDSDGSNFEPLTTAGRNLAPHFSPDDKWITFTSYRDMGDDPNGCEIYIMKLEDKSAFRLTNNRFCDWQPRWGP
jgi:TolB protein